MLRVERLSVHYDGMQALFGIDLHIDAGEIVSVLGSNGAGKSTFINAVSGMVRYSGDVTLDGKSLRNVAAHERVALGIVQVPEGRRLFPIMTVEENLLLGSSHKQARRERKASLAEAYELMPRLKERHRQIAKTLSGGEQQMVAIARALLSRPKVLMLDEPSLGLSPLLVNDLFGLIRRIRQRGVTVLLVEQNVKQSLQIVDRSYIFENGHVVMHGKGKDLLDDEHVKKAFLGM